MLCHVLLPGTDEGANGANDAEAPKIARPRPGHLESMTQSLLGDLASQMFLLKELSTDVQAIKTQQSMLSSQV